MATVLWRTGGSEERLEKCGVMEAPKDDHSTVKYWRLNRTYKALCTTGGSTEMCSTGGSTSHTLYCGMPEAPQ